MVGITVLVMLVVARNSLADSDGWVEATDRVAIADIGPHSFLRSGLFTVDMRLADPEKSLSACRLRNSDSEKSKWYTTKLACESFLYPSTRSLPQATEAFAIYEQNFSGTSSQAERMARALSTHMGLSRELLAGAVPDVLNTMLTVNGKNTTVGEAYAFHFKNDYEIVQWLYDRGARLCEKDFGPQDKRFSCVQFYLMNDRVIPGTRYDATLDVMERNGYRPRTAADIGAAMSFSKVPRRGQERRSFDRFRALLEPAERGRAELFQATADVEWAKSQGVYSATPAENLAAAKRLGEPGTPVCRAINIEGTIYRFSATVEGSSRTRLQLRVGTIRKGSQEAINVLYRENRVSPGSIFWDDAGSWKECE